LRRGRASSVVPDVTSAGIDGDASNHHHDAGKTVGDCSVVSMTFMEATISEVEQTHVSTLKH